MGIPKGTLTFIALGNTRKTT